MNRTSYFQRAKRGIRYRARNKGFALVVVLGILVLLVILAVGFLDSVGTERASSSSFNASVSARQYGDIAVSLVQGQINMATARGVNGAWVSQPGMVRTFKVNGDLLEAYKLYSAADMVSTSLSVANGKSADEPPATWGDTPALWTDLNAPVDVDGSRIFPILDPDAVLDGFALNNAPGATPYQKAPMPVRWLYILQDGSLVAPTGGSGKTATVPEDTADNPIVGRIAFWTDDETCKVNINTASEGTFWDVPRADSAQERKLAKFQPAQREYQRYPGHPAMTSLKSALPDPDHLDLQPDSIYRIVPRIVGGGSEQGTVVATVPVSPEDPRDRLYANVDELMFDPSRGSNQGVTRKQVEQARFFITAHSRAPEVNLYNLPRIACWPLFNNLTAGKVTAYDRLIAFCSTVSGHAYYFQRENSRSSTYDINITRNKELYAYLQYLTAQNVPGYGKDFFTKYGEDRDQILTEIFDYIRSTNLYDDNLSSGNQFTNGRATDTTNSPLSGHGVVVPSVMASNNTIGFGRFYTLSEFGIGFICNAVADDPATTGIDESYGSNDTGNNLVLGGTALQPGQKYIQAIAVTELFSAMQGLTIMRPAIRIRISGLDQLSVTTNSITQNLFPGLSDGTVVCTSDPNNIVGGRNAGGRCDWRYGFVTDTTEKAKGSPARGSIPGDTGNLGTDLYPFIGVPIKISAPAQGGTMTFSGGDLTVELYAADSSGGQSDLVQTIAIHLPAGTFPIPVIAKTNLGAVDTTSTKENWWSFSKVGGYRGKPGRLSYAAKQTGVNQPDKRQIGQFFRAECDVIRTVLPSHGDYRLIGGRRTVPREVFVPHRYYASTTVMAASNLNGEGSHAFPYFDSGGKYIDGIVYDTIFTPDINAAATAAERPQLTGDYDSGFANFSDGPFINKPDEGDSYRTATEIPYYDAPWKPKLGGATFFSPNRQIPSPGMFGSLPTGIKAGVPWRTLLFRPQANHPGSAGPGDHLMLDLFWMPVVEPYAISDRFSTAGKINMNFQIFPFTYIERSTGIRALLESEMLTAFPNSKAPTYKRTGYTDEFRKPINVKETLSQFTALFNSGNVFKSESDICNLWIIPQGESLGTMSAYWASRQLTGDNLRERIYATLYPRLTTKSNTYTVYFRAQSLKKVKGTPTGMWTEESDLVRGEYRGSTTIERFINPDAAIPDYAANPLEIPTKKTLDTFYKWRIIENKQFAP